MNEAARDRRRGRRAPRRARPGAKCSSSTTARPTRPASARGRPARASSAIRTTRATARRSRRASATPPATFVLIIDARRPASARGCAAHRRSPRRVRPRRRRARARDAGDVGAARAATRSSTGSPATCTGQPIPDLTSGFRGAAARLPARVPAPAARTDSRRRRPPRWRSSRRGLQRARSSRSTRGTRDGHARRSGSRATAPSSS